MSGFATTIEGLLGAFCLTHPKVRVRVSSLSDAEAHDALGERRIDVACVFLAEWPIERFGALRLVECPTNGVLLPAARTLAASPAVRLQDLASLPWLHSAPQRWPGFMRVYEDALGDRGLVPPRRRERSRETPSANVQIAAGEAWTLAGDVVAAAYRTAGSPIVYRPFVGGPIPCSLALVWLEATQPVQRLVEWPAACIRGAI